MRVLLAALLLAGPAAAKPGPDPLAAGTRAFEQGDHEKAAELLADALFADPGSLEARRLLRESAARLLDARERRIGAERLEIRCRLGLARPGDCPEPEPEPEEEPVFIGPPTPAAVSAAPPPKRRLKKRKGGTAVAVPVPAEKPPPTAADREMSRIFYYQGLKAYAEHEIQEAKAAWRKALELDPQNERAKQALARLGEAP